MDEAGARSFMGPGDDIGRHQGPIGQGRRLPRFYSRPDGTDITTDFDSHHATAAGRFEFIEDDIRRFDHGICHFNGTAQAQDFDEP